MKELTKETSIKTLILIAICVSVAISIQTMAQNDCYPSVDLSTWEFNNNSTDLTVYLKKDDDGIVNGIRSATDLGTVKIGKPSWDNLTDELSLQKMVMDSAFVTIRTKDFVVKEERMLYWVHLSFPEDSEMNLVADNYWLLSYVDYVVSRNFYFNPDTGEQVTADIVFIIIKEGNDELLGRLRLASEEEVVKIGDSFWDEISAELQLKKITEGIWAFELRFLPSSIDPVQIAKRYCQLPYVEFVVLDWLIPIDVGMSDPIESSVVSESSWGEIKQQR